MQIDIIMTSYAKSDRFAKMTQTAIQSCHASAISCTFNIVIIEQNKEVKYANATTVHYNYPFNYNKCMNDGISRTRNQYVFFGNNDLEFSKGWAETIVAKMQQYEALSASPFCPVSLKKIGANEIRYGYKLRQEICGWAIIVDRKIFDRIGKLKEDVKFWYSDNLYADQLQAHSITHIMVYDSVVTHLENGSTTLKTMDSKTAQSYMLGQLKAYQKSRNIVAKKESTFYFSVIMPSYLGNYHGAAKNREDKFKRAIDSLLRQTFTNFEIIVVSDGCVKTEQILSTTYREHLLTGKIKGLKIGKNKLWSGTPRNVGIEKASGEWIVYLDTDDGYQADWLQRLHDAMQQHKDIDWFTFPDLFYRKESKEFMKGIFNLNKKGGCGTSNIAHRRSMAARWQKSDYGEDWVFIQALKAESSAMVTLDIQGGYCVCHMPFILDYDGEV